MSDCLLLRQKFEELRKMSLEYAIHIADLRDNLANREKIREKFLWKRNSFEKRWNTLKVEIQEGCLKPNECFLQAPSEENLPTLEKMLDKQNGYQFDKIILYSISGEHLPWTEDSLKRLRMIPEDCRIHFDDTLARQEKRVQAKVVCIADLIAEKKEKDPTHADTLSLLELAEMTIEGYRHATLNELLVYAKTHWHPNPDLGHPLTERERLGHHDAAVVLTFNYSKVSPTMTALDARRGSRVLTLHVMKMDWEPKDCFLFIRK